jgi:hypothetical protein
VTEKRGTRRAQNRHGGAPRGERPASWDARRLARRLTRRVMACPTGVPPSTPTSLGAPPTPRSGVSEAKRQSPDAAMRARERDGLFDIVSWELRNPAVGIACPGRDAARAQRSGASLIRDRQRLRRSRVCSAPLRAALRPGHPLPSCFETARIMMAPAPFKSPRPSRRKTRDTRKTRTATGRTATADAVSEHR